MYGGRGLLVCMYKLIMRPITCKHVQSEHTLVLTKAHTHKQTNKETLLLFCYPGFPQFKAPKLDLDGRVSIILWRKMTSVKTETNPWAKVFVGGLKGSVERSLLPWAIFLIFTQNRPWKSEDHLCMLFFIEMSKERLEKSERTPPISWRPWALAYSRDRPYNFSCLSALSKNGLFRSFFSELGCHLASKSLSWPAMPVSNKKQGTPFCSTKKKKKIQQLVTLIIATPVPFLWCITTVQSPFLNLAPTTLHYFTKSISKLSTNNL